MAVGRPPKPPKPKKMLKEILPVDDIFDVEEKDLFNNLIDVYIADFDIDDLTSSDMDDILDLAKNRVLEFRLLKNSKDSISKQMDAAMAIEKLSRKNEKIKESLSSRRKDRINPNDLKGFSIVDLAVAFNQEKKQQLNEHMKKMRAEEQEALEKRKDYQGNKNDVSDVGGN